MTTLSSCYRNRRGIKREHGSISLRVQGPTIYYIFFLSLHFGSPLISSGNAICFFMVSMHSFLSDIFKRLSNSISSSIHQCSGRKCSHINSMEISFYVHSFWRKLHVHMLKSQPPYLGKCQAYHSVYKLDVCRH